jgi:hypothetical protein
MSACENQRAVRRRTGDDVNVLMRRSAFAGVGVGMGIIGAGIGSPEIVVIGTATAFCFGHGASRSYSGLRKALLSAPAPLG